MICGVHAFGSPPRLAELADHLVSLTDAYTGLRVLGPTAVEVALVESVNVDLGSIQSRFPEIELRFTKAKFSRVDANALRLRIASEWSDWPARGVIIHQLHQDPAGRVVIGVADPSSARLVSGSVRRGPVAVELGEPAEAL